MSKNFEEEYKALANEELPDLWNRIEAGLTPKNTALLEEETDKQIVKEKEKKVISFFYRHRTAAAAALCAVVIIPAVIVLGRTGRSKSWESADESAPEDMNHSVTWDEAAAVAEEAAEEAVDDSAEEAADLTAGEMAEGGIANMAQAKSCDLAEDTTANADADAGADAGKDEASYEAADADGNFGMVKSEAAPAEDLMEDTGKRMEDKENQKVSGAGAVKEESREDAGAVTVYKDVVVKVTEITEETVSTDKNIFYGMKAEIIKDPAGELGKGTEITIWIPFTSSVAYLEGTEYILNLSYSEDRECPYRIA